MELIEYVSGARMHACLYMPLQSMVGLITTEFINKVYLFIKNTNKTISEIYINLYNNRVWRLRLTGVGVITAQLASISGISGVICRSCGIFYDIRCNNLYGYGIYNNLNFTTFLGILGDSYDRFIQRIRELFESARIILITLTNLQINNGIYTTTLQKYNKGSKLESIILLFNRASGMYNINVGCFYGTVESGKGAFQVTLITNNTNKPYRIYIRSPAYMHLQLLPLLCSGLQLADVSTLLGTLDIVFGEVDR